MIPRQGVSWTTCFAVLLSIAFSDASSASPFSPQSVQDWMKARCGDNGNAVWVYNGALYDPLDGHKIASVEGLELVRRLGDTNDDKSPSRRAALKAHALKGDYSATILSRKLFCYQSPSNPQKLLDQIRLRPNAPLRRIPTNQAVALYDTATTYVSCYSKGRMIVHTEWPNGKCIWGEATASGSKEDNENRSFCFHIFARPQSKALPDLNRLIQSDKDQNVVVAPKRSKLVQFGASTAEKKKFGASETYSYTTEERPPNKWWKRLLMRRQPLNTDCRVHYTRYGEGPPWYGPGKYCMLELQGRRASIQEAPPLVASIAAQRVPGFLSVDSPISTEKKAIEWFRRGNLQLQMNDDLEIVHSGWKRLASRVGKGGSALFHKIRAASTLIPLDVIDSN